jgi:hypothetical protein
MDKYQALRDDYYFGFEIFEEVLKVINERENIMDDPNFNAGVASCDAAVRRLREEHYNAIFAIIENQDNE